MTPKAENPVASNLAKPDQDSPEPTEEPAASNLAKSEQEAESPEPTERGNPNPQNIKKMFSTLGIDDVFDGLSWQRMSTSALRKKLQDFSALRNEVVHGANKRVRKQVLVNHLNVFKNFATRLDAKLRRDIRSVGGTHPW